MRFFRAKHTCESHEAARSSNENAIYQSLDPAFNQVRLLQLEPGNLSDDIRGSLRIVSLAARDQLPDYECVSYCWGHVSTKTSITLNESVFSAPSTAVEALRYLRHIEESRHLWIDSICINQDDTTEREYQVGLMARIYQGGWQTLIWLGMPDEDTEKAVDVCLRFETAIARQAETVGDFLKIINEIELPPDWDITSVRSILHRPFFERVWVYQEIVLSRDCCCVIGKFTFRWVLLELISKLLLSRFDHDTRVKVYGDDWHDFHQYLLPYWTHYESIAPRKGRKLSNLVQRTRDLRCSDPRDKIYGILGLVGTWTPEKLSSLGIKIDYRAPIASCIRAGVVAMFKEDKNLHSMVDRQRWPILTSRDNPEGWPSWAPRLDKPRRDLDPHPFSNELEDGHSADNKRPLLLRDRRVSDHPNALFVSGIRVGSVTMTFHPFREDPAYLCAFICKLYELVTPDFGFTFHETISAGQYPTQLVPRTDEFASFWSSFKKSLDTFWDTEVMWAKQDLSEDLRKLWLDITYHCRNRRCFLMNHNVFGLGPFRMEKGDIICILFGGPWPVVLRPHRGWFEFIQPCFISNIMNGEAVREWEAKGEDPEVFELR